MQNIPQCKSDRLGLWSSEAYSRRPHIHTDEHFLSKIIHKYVFQEPLLDVSRLEKICEVHSFLQALT